MNRGALRAQALSWLKAKSQSARISPETVNGLINLTIRACFKQKKLRWSETTLSGTAVAALAPSVNLPDRFIRYNAVRWFSGDTSVPLDPLIKSVWDRRYMARDSEDKISNTGAPEHFIVYGGQLLLGPRPEDAGTVSVDFDQYPTDIPDGAEGDDEEPEILLYAWETILFGTLANCSLYVIEDSRAPTYEAKYAAGLNALNAEHAVARTSGGRRHSQEPG